MEIVKRLAAAEIDLTLREFWLRPTEEREGAFASLRAERPVFFTPERGFPGLALPVGPGFWFFNTQFAYEAFAIVLFIWSCVALVHLVRAPATSPNRVGWLIVALWISFTLVGSHHLSSYANLIVLGALTGVAVLRWVLRRERAHNAGELVLLFVTVLALTGWWFANQAPNTKAYLEPYLKGGVTQVAGFSVGVVERSGIIDGSKVKAGDAIIGMASSGVHSNGYSLVRKLIQVAGADEHTQLDGRPLFESVLGLAA